MNEQDAPPATTRDEFWGPFAPAPSEMRHGRSVRDGYARGWGLQFNDLRGKILQDPLFLEAVRLAEGRSVMSEYNRLNIFLIMRYFLEPYSHGHVVEFGTYRGGSALFMAYVARALYPKMRIYALDTFEGMPPTDSAVDAHGEGDFRDTSVDELTAVAAQHGLHNVSFIKGRFEDTAPALLREEIGQVALAHVDCDIYSAVAYSYDVVRPFMLSGGYIVFDDATVPSCIGATEAVESLVIRRDGLNSEQIYPHFVFRAP